MTVQALRPRPKRDAVLCFVLALWFAIFTAPTTQASPGTGGDPFLKEPIWVYNNWTAYDELADVVRLTEDLAMRELDEIVRLRGLGVRIDYYVMDAFWYARSGGYRRWRTRDWPVGPDRWLEACRQHGIVPGLWFGTNTLTKIHAVPAWQSSLNERGEAMSFYAGGFLADFMEVLQLWYDRGIRLFKFDFADFGAAAAGTERVHTHHEIRLRNTRAFREELRAFRERNPGVVLVAFNGFGGDMESTAAPFPFEDIVDLQWLDVFDSLYAGDPRPADVPHMNFWRSVDVYSDHMVRRFEQSGVPLPRIDSTAFMIGHTGSNYFRGINAWQGSLLLTVAREGWVNTVHGNLEFLDDDRARWFARLQSLYAPLQQAGTTRSFGGLPGDAEPYGYVSAEPGGALYTVVNPSQRVAAIRLPRASRDQPLNSGGRVLFRDAGFEPRLQRNSIQLGPGQLALVGFGRYANPVHDLGVQEDVQIPRKIEPLPVLFTGDDSGRIAEAAIDPPPTGDLRIVMQQRYTDGSIIRSKSHGDMANFLTITADQDGKSVRVVTRYDKVIWSGLSWAVGEIRRSDIDSTKPIRVRLSSAERDFPVVLDGQAFRVTY